MSPGIRLLLIVAAVLCLGSIKAKAQSGQHGEGHAEMHGAYEQWKDGRGFSCCNSSDCRPVRADLIGEGRWSVWIDGRWLPVPPDAVLGIPSPDGRSHVCIAAGALEPRCFVPGDVRG